MKTIIQVLVTVVLSMGLLVACTDDQKNAARAIAAASIDAACNNLPNMDAQFQAVAPRANGAAKAGYQSAKAVIQSVCDNRPLTNPEQQAAAVTAAVVKITGILAALLGGN